MEQRHAAPTTQRPNDQSYGSIADSLGRDSMTTAMLAFAAKSNGKATQWALFQANHNVRRSLAQAANGLAQGLSHVCGMATETDQEIHVLFTQIGCIMDDASTIALLWEKASDLKAIDRLVLLENANHEIAGILTKIRASVC